jgi:alkyl hydroperoxide reductase subunit AhpC
LIEGRLVLLDSTQFAGRMVALCFLPYVSIVDPDFLDRQADDLDGIGTTLLIVSSGTRPLHRVWMDRQAKPCTPLLYDPLRRLHRAFGVPPVRMPVRCQTFLIDCWGFLRFHVIHDFTDRGLTLLQETLTRIRERISGHTTADGDSRSGSAQRVT